MKSPTIPEVEPQFEKEIDPFQQSFQQPFQAQVIRCETPTLSARSRKNDALLLLKADKSELIDAYSKTEADALLDDKLNVSDQIDTYNKIEVDAILDDKLNISDQIDAYTKSEDDALLLLKADKSELADYVNLGIAQTISGQKQFNIITVANVSKQSKNDVSILLPGGCNMLLSSLVNQTELQEVRDIASGKSKAYVFDTLLDLND
ncbi:MAG: hypothetical protein EZS28_011535 [Streblomastix strix]|uniref:Uncharacterized protein n=1 Tax=Streblomastix strix TaxID=222440 RepID=A0A5J4WD94_9EUKA|nr:MAG: hypothetical protein EZS28_011535 [Streblomastix strix]